jgi:hypothetical protein
MSYDPPDDCEPDARVYVHTGADRTRLPIINEGVVTRITTDGPTDLTRYSEVYFPAEWGGENYANVLRSGSDVTIPDVRGRRFTPDRLEDYADAIEDAVNGVAGGLPTVADIQIRDHASGAYRTVHRGVVTGVGGSSGSHKEMRFVVRDPSVYLGLAASFSINYGAGALSAALQNVAEAIESTAPVFDSVPVKALIPPEEDDADSPVLGLFVKPMEFFSNLDELSSPRTKGFQANRDSLGDVIQWVRNELDQAIKVWFEPYTTDGGTRTVALTVAPDPTRRFISQGIDPDEESPYADAKETRLIFNDALYEISPINAVDARGTATWTAIEVSGHEVRTGDLDDDYPYAIVQHDPTVARAGQRVTRAVDVPANTISSAESQAKNELESMIQGSGRGTIDADLDPDLRPYDLLRAVPICRDFIDDPTPLNYQVVGVVHHVKADYDTDEDIRRPHTQLKVRQDARPETFTVVQSGTRQTQDSESGDTGVPDNENDLPLLSTPTPIDILDAL